LKAFAGSAPVTKASGRSIRITHRHVKNHQLAAVGFVWAFIAAGCDGPTACKPTNLRTYEPIKAYGPPPTHPTVISSKRVEPQNAS
jgi:hypothetical protein